MKEIFFLIILVISFNSWSQTIQKSENIEQIKLRSDGIYSTYDTSMLKCGVKIVNHYHTYNHLNIINVNCLVFNNGVGSYDNYFLKKKSYENIIKSCGKYIVKDNIIYATDVPIGLLAWGGRLKIYYANFIGKILNSDTIMDWKMVPPYPKANKRLNDNFKFETTLKLLYFIQSKELLGLDSLYKASQR